MKKKNAQYDASSPTMFRKFAIYMLIAFFLMCIISLLSNLVIWMHGIMLPGTYGKIITISILLVATSVIGFVFSCVAGKKLFKKLNEISAAMQRVADGDFSVRVTVPEVTNELSTLAKNFNLMANELSNTEMLRNDFIVNVSHEFKTPLAAIQNCASLIDSDDITPEERREYGHLLRHSADHLITLCTDILKISKIENLEILTNKSSFSLDEEIRCSLIMLEKLWSEKEINLEIDLPKCIVFANRELISNVFLNIISNAIKFTPRGGNIWISLVTENGFAKITVRDDGIGMSEETVKHIFEKFYQGDSSHQSEGNGLGLAFVKRAIDLHQGHITVESAEGAGSSFTVVIPV